MLEGFGPEKLLFIVVVMLLLFGAKRLPEIGSSLGKGIREFKKSVHEIGAPTDVPASTPTASAQHAEFAPPRTLAQPRDATREAGDA